MWICEKTRGTKVQPQSAPATLQDTEDSPEPVSGWSAERAKRFGASVLSPIYEVLPLLRDVPKPQKK